MKEQVGKPLGEADLGMITLAIYREISDETFSLRSLSRFDDTTGAITTFGNIEQGAVVKVCGASREQVLQGASAALSAIRRRGFSPAAAVIISCAGRKWLLDDCGREEVALVQAAMGSHVPLIGFPSLGEIGPYLKDDGTYSDTLFHNVTFVVCLLGE
jgi:hypothetical protein